MDFYITGVCIKTGEPIPSCNIAFKNYFCSILVKNYHIILRFTFNQFGCPDHSYRNQDARSVVEARLGFANYA